ncbi:MAG TPA: hypothetical protein VK850_14350 [Candidatus Binatia bacterium]|nr:hypothetical protein [Candidatus Binatia bacterium]
MDDITPIFTAYREAVRHLWNTAFRPLAEPTRNWDIRNDFDQVARPIFSAIVLSPLGGSFSYAEIVERAALIEVAHARVFLS